MNKKRYTYLGLYENGELSTVAQIHAWHDNKNLTVEYLPYLDMLTFVSLGWTPSFEPINVESTHDICLDDLPEPYDGYKLHYTFITIAGEFVAAEREWERKRHTMKGAIKNGKEEFSHCKQPEKDA